MTSPEILLDYLQLQSADLQDLARAASTDPSGCAVEALDAALLHLVRSLPFGTPFTFVEQYDGALVHDLRPTAGREEERSSQGRVALDIHTDDSFLIPQARPEYMALFGVENPARVPTCLVRVNDVLDALRSETRDVLRMPLFIFGRPASFHIRRDAHRDVPPRPILRTGANGHLEVALGTRTSVAAGVCREAVRHLELFRQAIEHAPRHDIVLQAGDALFFSNARCLHGRPAVLGRRWIKRIYLRKDLRTLDARAATSTPGVYIASRAVDPSNR